MNAKKSGWLFFAIIVIYIGTSFALSIFAADIKLSFEFSTFLSEALIWVPALLCFAICRVNPVKFCHFRKMHVSTALMTVLFAFMAMPAATLTNIISMFFVENEVNLMSGSMLEAGFPLMFLCVAVYAPLSEELVFRGALFQGYRQSASPLKAILISSLLFGLMHLNFNQAGYAFVLGVIMALLVEATGSIWSSFILHMTVNARSVVLLFLTDKMTGFAQDMAGADGLMENMNTAVTNKELFMMLCFEILVAVVCLPIAGCILVWIAKREGRLDKLQALWPERKSGKVWTVATALSVIICIGFMVWSVVYCL
ncbi:MAG: lysostaphin resistance A-like protein [Lachnospiraceae bacterium]